MMQENEIDDFANDKEIIKRRQELAAFKKMIEESVSIATNSFNAVASSHKNLKGFLLHKSVEQPFIEESYKGAYKSRDFYCCLFNYYSSVSAGKVQDSGHDYYLCGVIELNHSYPHTIAQPETFALKIEDLIKKMDVDFAHAKKFSRKFHVVSKDAYRLKGLLQFKELDMLADFPEAEFELIDKQCYFRAGHKPVSLKEAEKFSALAKTLFDIF